MALTKARDFEERLKKCLKDGFDLAGITAKIAISPIPGTKLHRVLVTAPQFARLRPSERQDLVWRIVSQHFTPDEQLRISMIVTLALGNSPARKWRLEKSRAS